jgi:DNA-binding transcriptional regulator GbsR (MarR family)
MLGTYNVPFDLEGNSPLTLVQDIRKLENPLQTDSFEREYQKRSRYFAELNIKNWPKEQKGDWNETLKDMSESVKEQEKFYEKHKSLLQRLRRKK